MSTSRISANSLRSRYAPEHFNFSSTAQLEDLKEPLGQQRAMEALKFATEMKSAGYNIFALGTPGIGKHQIVTQFLEQKSANEQAPCAWVYVYNFEDESQPLAISFPAGQAKVFQKLIQHFIEDLRTSIPSIYESERFRTRRDDIIKEFKDQQDKVISELQDRAKKENIFLLNIRGGLIFAQGDKDGNIIDEDALSKLSEEEQKKITDRVTKYNDELINVVNQFPLLERQMRIRIKALNKEMISAVVEALSKDLIQKYANNEKVSQYLQSMVKDIIENARNFRRDQDEKVELLSEMPSPLKRYQVNVIVDNSAQCKAPVVYEDNPTFMNLVGQIEHLSQLGVLSTDFTLIKAGALHRANGGYLILDAQKLLVSPYAWEGLKRILRSGYIRIESLGQVYSLVSTATLKPESIPLNCKIILIGDPEVYHLLVQYDSEFSDLFKVSADFENEIPCTTENKNQFACFLSSLVRKNNLLHLDPSGVAKMLEQSFRLSADSERISLAFDSISNLLKESDFFARELKKNLISEAEVQKAIEAQVHRLSRIYEKVIDETMRGTLLVDVKGKHVGQINALSVFEFGNHLFGHPSRITAIARMGEGHVIDIERETKMGGPIHSKGVLILSGFLKSRFAIDLPLSISASLVFEQSYGPVEGDSASLAELTALLSALSQVSINQSIAITGSVNQHGEAQPVGAVNEKIEGFFDLCRRKGLTGEQGVIIPRANIKHLTLRNDVIEAIEKNEFFIYAIDSIDDCMELITETPFQTIVDKIEVRLHTFAEQLNKIPTKWNPRIHWLRKPEDHQFFLPPR